MAATQPILPDVTGRTASVAGEDLQAHPRGAATGRGLLILVTVLFLAVVSPVVVRGAPLADDFHTCMRPIDDGSFAPFLADSWRDLGMVRPARFVEIAAIGGLCERIPFGFIVLIPLALKLAVSFLLLGLLRDLSLRRPWPEIGGALWLLEPLGAEAALWPSALHVPLGLAFAVGALRLYRRGRLGLGVMLTLGACLSVEQVIFAFPLAAWLLSGDHRRRATAASAVVVAAVILVYATWPGNDFRTVVSLSDRLGSVVENPAWYVFFPAVGAGLHSGPLAVAWAFPVSVVVVLSAVLLGAGVTRRRAARQRAPAFRSFLTARSVCAVVALVVLVNLPLIVTAPRGYTPRTFTPTWLLLSAVLAVSAAHARWRPGRLAGAVAGGLAALAVLSLALSVSVRVRTADFTEASSQWLARQIPDGGSVEVCDVPRTVVTPAPLGAFALHELHWTWATQDAVRYYTGRDLQVRRSGKYWPGPCPSSPPADVTIDFAQLQHAAAER
jgi:hypothetical protein